MKKNRHRKEAQEINEILKLWGKAHGVKLGIAEIKTDLSVVSDEALIAEIKRREIKL